jgi:hypothetical protein
MSIKDEIARELESEKPKTPKTIKDEIAAELEAEAAKPSGIKKQILDELEDEQKKADRNVDSLRQRKLAGETLTQDQLRLLFEDDRSRPLIDVRELPTFAAAAVDQLGSMARGAVELAGATANFGKEAMASSFQKPQPASGEVLGATTPAQTPKPEKLVEAEKQLNQAWRSVASGVAKDAEETANSGVRGSLYGSTASDRMREVPGGSPLLDVAMQGGPVTATARLLASALVGAPSPISLEPQSEEKSFENYQLRDIMRTAEQQGAASNPDRATELLSQNPLLQAAAQKAAELQGASPEEAEKAKQAYQDLVLAQSIVPTESISDLGEILSPLSLPAAAVRPLSQATTAAIETVGDVASRALLKPVVLGKHPIEALGAGLRKTGEIARVKSQDFSEWLTGSRDSWIAGMHTPISMATHIPAKALEVPGRFMRDLGRQIDDIGIRGRKGLIERVGADADSADWTRRAFGTGVDKSKKTLTPEEFAEESARRVQRSSRGRNRARTVDWVIRQSGALNKSGVNGAVLGVMLALPDIENAEDLARQAGSGYGIGVSMGADLARKAEVALDPETSFRQKLDTALEIDARDRQRDDDADVERFRKSASPETLAAIDRLSNPEEAVNQIDAKLSQAIAKQQSNTEQGILDADLDDKIRSLRARREVLSSSKPEDIAATRRAYSLIVLDAFEKAGTLASDSGIGSNMNIRLLNAENAIDFVRELYGSKLTEAESIIANLGAKNDASLSDSEKAMLQLARQLVDKVQYTANELSQTRGAAFSKRSYANVDPALRPQNLEIPSMFVNLDAILSSRNSFGDMRRVLHHEIFHNLLQFKEVQDRLTPLRDQLFGRYNQNVDGTVSQQSPGIISDDQLDYAAEVYAAHMANPAAWKNSMGSQENMRAYIREEILAELSGFSNNDAFSLRDALDSPGQAIADWVNVGSKNRAVQVLKSALQSTGLFDEAGRFSDILGLTLTPQMLALYRQFERSVRSLNGALIEAASSSDARQPEVSIPELLTNRVLQEKYKDTSEVLSTEIAIVIRDKDGVTLREIKVTPDLEQAAARLVQEYRVQNGRLVDENGREMTLPPTIDMSNLPEGAKVSTDTVIKRNVDGTPIQLTAKEVKSRARLRGKLIREAVDRAPNDGTPNRFQDVGNGVYRGILTPSQLAAIDALSNDIVSPSLKRRIRSFNTVLQKQDGTRIVMEYQAALKAGKYKSLAPRIRDVVPIGFHFSKDGNFLATTISVSRMFDKLNLWSEKKPERLNLWGRDKAKFWTDVHRVLVNHQAGEKGAVGLDTDPAIALQKKNIVNDFFNLFTKDTEGLNPDRSRLPVKRGQDSADRLIMSARMDRINAFEISSAEKIPVDYGKMTINFMPASENDSTPERIKLAKSFMSKQKISNSYRVRGAAWLGKNLEWINVSNHIDVFPEEYVNMRRVDYEDVMAAGYVRVQTYGDTIYYEGSPTRKQRKEIEDTAIENGMTAVYDSPGGPKFMPGESQDYTRERLTDLFDRYNDGDDLTSQDMIDELQFISQDAPEGYFSPEFLERLDEAARGIKEQYSEWGGRDDLSIVDQVINEAENLLSRPDSGQPQFMPGDFVARQRAKNVTQFSDLFEIAKNQSPTEVARILNGMTWYHGGPRPITGTMTFDEANQHGAHFGQTLKQAYNRIWNLYDDTPSSFSVSLGEFSDDALGRNVAEVELADEHETRKGFVYKTRADLSKTLVIPRDVDDSAALTDFVLRPGNPHGLSVAPLSDSQIAEIKKLGFDDRIDATIDQLVKNGYDSIAYRNENEASPGQPGDISILVFKRERMLSPTTDRVQFMPREITGNPAVWEELYHTTNAEGARDIQQNGFRIIASSEQRLFPETVSLTTDTWGLGSHVVLATLEAENPLLIRVSGKRRKGELDLWDDFAHSDEKIISPAELGKRVVEFAKQNGHDVIVARGVPGVGKEYAVLKPNKLKATSAYPKFMPTANGFYSRLGKGFEEQKQEKFTAQQAEALARKFTNEEELKWTGIIPWIQDRESVTKQDILDYLQNEGNVELAEIVLGDSSETETVWRVKKNGSDVYSTSFRSPQEAINEIDAVEGLSLEESGYEIVPVRKPKKRKDELPRNTNWTLPGGDNHREIVLKAPGFGPSSRTITYYKVMKGGMIQMGGALYLTEDHARRAVRQINNATVEELGATIEPVQKLATEEQIEIDIHQRSKALANVGGSKSDEEHWKTLDDDKKRFYLKAARDAIGGVAKSQYPFSSSDTAHYSDLKALAWTRVNDRIDADGKPGLFIEEIQSKLHQVGREKGYRDTLQMAISPFGTVVPATMDEAAKVPDAPFRKTWPLQMFKRALREAVETGKEWIGWTTGETQAERYDLSKQVDKIDYDKAAKQLFIWPKGSGRSFSSAIVKTATIEELPDVIGKELAAKISENPSNRQTYSGLDLKVGGEGMKGFYDQILPKEIAKYVKQWGGKVERGDIELGELKVPKLNPITDVDWEAFAGAEEFSDKIRPYIGELAVNGRPASIIVDRNGVSVIGGEAEFEMSMFFREEDNTSSREGLEQANSILEDLLSVKTKEEAENLGWEMIIAPDENMEFKVSVAGEKVPIHRVSITPEMRRDVITQGQPQFMPSVTYDLPHDPKVTMADFYVLSYLETMPFDKIFASSVNSPDRIRGLRYKEYENDLDYAKRIFYPNLQEKLLDAVYFAIAAEFRHGLDNKQPKEIQDNPLYQQFIKYHSAYKAGYENRKPGEDAELKGQSDSYETSYAALRRAADKLGWTRTQVVSFAQTLFSKGRWNSAYGGRAWAGIADGWLMLRNAQTLSQKAVAIDHVYDLQHNTDTVFNKLQNYYRASEGHRWIKKMLDFKANAKSIRELLPFVSSKMRKIALPVLKDLEGRGEQVERPVSEMISKSPQPKSQKTLISSESLLSAFKPFSKEDWWGWAGAEPFSPTDPPLIYEWTTPSDIANTLIIDKTGIQIHSFDAHGIEFNYGVYHRQGINKSLKYLKEIVSAKSFEDIASAKSWKDLASEPEFDKSTSPGFDIAFKSLDAPESVDPQSKEANQSPKLSAGMTTADFINAAKKIAPDVQVENLHGFADSLTFELKVSPSQTIDVSGDDSKGWDVQMAGKVFGTLPSLDQVFALAQSQAEAHKDTSFGSSTSDGKPHKSDTLHDAAKSSISADFMAEFLMKYPDLKITGVSGLGNIDEFTVFNPNSPKSKRKTFIEKRNGGWSVWEIGRRIKEGESYDTLDEAVAAVFGKPKKTKTSPPKKNLAESLVNWASSQDWSKSNVHTDPQGNVWKIIDPNDITYGLTLNNHPVGLPVSNIHSASVTANLLFAALVENVSDEELQSLIDSKKPGGPGFQAMPLSDVGSDIPEVIDGESGVISPLSAVNLASEPIKVTPGSSSMTRFLSGLAEEPFRAMPGYNPRYSNPDGSFNRQSWIEERKKAETILLNRGIRKADASPEEYEEMIKQVLRNPRHQ